MHYNAAHTLFLPGMPFFMPFQNSLSFQNQWQIRALSFDFDGCIFHSRYRWRWNDISPENTNQVIDKNKPFLDKLKKENASFDETIVFVGSMRQSEALDALNSASVNPALATESCFSAIRKICGYLAPIMLDKFLLADVFCNWPNGASFDQAIARIDETKSNFHEKLAKGEYNLKLISDKTKLTILYAQMHKLAKAYPNSRILFDFYDDKGDIASNSGKKALLDGLYDYFQRFPEIIPANVTLRLNLYKGKKVTPYPFIQGSGLTDMYYRSTIKEMVHIARKAEPTAQDLAAIKHVVPSSLLFTNKKKRDTIRHGSLGFFNPYKPSLGNYIDSLLQKANNPIQASFRP